MSKKTTINKTYLITGVVVGGVAILTLLITLLLNQASGPESPKTYTLTNAESDAPLGIKIAIDSSNFSDSLQKLYRATGGPNAISSDVGHALEKDCRTMGLIAKKLDPSAQWFSSCTGYFYASNPNTDSRQIFKLSDGTYCATFTFNSSGMRSMNEYLYKYDVLESYFFSTGQCGDVTIAIE